MPQYTELTISQSEATKTVALIDRHVQVYKDVLKVIEKDIKSYEEISRIESSEQARTVAAGIIENRKKEMIAYQQNEAAWGKTRQKFLTKPVFVLSKKEQKLFTRIKEAPDTVDKNRLEVLKSYPNIVKRMKADTNRPFLKVILELIKEDKHVRIVKK